MTGTFPISDGWRLRGFLGEDWRARRAHLPDAQRPDDRSAWVPARVPGSVLADLLAAGAVPDPYVGTQSLLSEWVPQRAWVYRTTLRTSQADPHSRAFLEFDGIDHSATVHLDGEQIATHRGTFVPLVVEVTGRIAAGEHTLAVVVDPAPDSQPQVGRTSSVTVHKGRMGYGWDFCPRLIHQGLWAPIRLRTTGPVRIADVWARPRTSLGSARVEVTVRADGHTPGTTIRHTLRDPAGKVVATEHGPVDGATVHSVLSVEDPLPWRPNGCGPAHLYRLTTTVLDADGRPGDERRSRVGLRDIRFTRDPGAPATSLPYRLLVDGAAAYIKGWNWVPADALYGSTDPARLRHLLSLARDAGVTMLRVWGGGLIESEAFYDLCDEFGILVWQEFAQSSSGEESLPSEDPAFVAEMCAQARHIVPTRRNHPSLAMWCGGNELQRVDGTPLPEGESPVLAALGEVVRELDPDRHWLPTSPSGPVFGNTLESVRQRPEQHDVHGPWEHQGLADHYRLYDTGRSLLLSEFGAEGMSNVRAIESVVPAAARTLPTAGNPIWEHLGRWWNNEGLVREAFGGALRTIRDLSRASQFLQADGLRYAVEANRRRPASCGVLPWQLNESFPNGWCTAAVDYFGEPKAAYHYIRRAYRPLHVCAALAAPRLYGDEFVGTVWAWDDGAGGGGAGGGAGGDGGAGGGPAVATARVLRLDGSEVARGRWDVELRPGEPQPLGQLRCPSAELGAGPFLLDLAVRSGARAADNRYLLTAGTDFSGLLALPPAQISTQLHTDGTRWSLELYHHGGPVAPFLRLLDARPARRPGWLRLSDNAFDLLPGERRVVTVVWDGVPPHERRLVLDGWSVLANAIEEAA